MAVDERSQEQWEVFVNRRRQIRELRDRDGRSFTKVEIRVMAESPEVDVHLLRNLLRDGCDLDTARAIVL